MSLVSICKLDINSSIVKFASPYSAGRIAIRKIWSSVKSEPNVFKLKFASKKILTSTNVWSNVYNKVP